MAYTTIDDPSAHFQTLLYTGNGSNNRALVNDGNSDLQPDFVWIKERNATSTHQWLDSSRGVALALSSPDNGADESYAYLDSFDSDGFTIDQSDGSTNENNNTFVAWQWKCNGGTTTDVSASGSGNTQIIASTHQANTDAGFSIVTFTAPDVASGSNYTVSHGLGGVAELIILKSRNPTGNWHVYHKGTGNTGVTFLNTTAAFYDNIYFADTTPSSTVFTVGARTSLDPTHTAVVYCFRSIKGYSRIGKYTGIGSDNGTFVYTGFKPAWVMIKRTNAVGAWEIYDTKRAKISGSNQMERTDLQADSTGAENASTIGNGIDILSNGFRPTTGTLYLNGAGSTYIYLAFAEHPFVSSEGTPTTAR